MAILPAMRDALAAIFTPERVKTAPADLKFWGTDWTRGFDVAPFAIVFPERVEEVVAITRLANERGFGLVPSGGRTGLSGGAVATNGEVVVSFDRMNRILGFDATDRVVRCQAGVPTQALQEYAAAQGCFYPVDFASAGSSQIGGNVATNAGGVKVIRYGLTRDWVAGLKVVTGTGDPVGLMVEAGAESSLYGPSEPASALGVFVRPDHVTGVQAATAAEAVPSPGEMAADRAGGADERLTGGVVPSSGTAVADEAVLGLCRDLVSQGVRQVVVSLPRHRRADEERLRELVRDRYPDHYLRSIPLTLGSEVADINDDELRTATAVLNAYLSRPMAKLLYRTEGLLQRAGLGVPLLAVRSDGSCARTARTTAISTYSSGPAAGLGLVAAEAAARGDEAAVGFDMGGTTLDLGLVRGGAYTSEETPAIRGVRVSLPVPGVTSVGLGGSSIAAADSAGEVKVGPASAGAVPGPAAFGRGGTDPTLTDADVALGFLADGATLIGDIALDAEQARSALVALAGTEAALDGAESALAGTEAALSSGDPVEAALRVRSAAHRQAASALEDLLAAAAIDPAAVTLYAFGGAGGLHAGPVADLAGIARVRSFVHGGVFSARGVAGAPLRQVYRASAAPGKNPDDMVSQLTARARLDLEAERLPPDEARITADAGEGWVEVTSQLDPPPTPPVVVESGRAESPSSTVGPSSSLDLDAVPEPAEATVPASTVEPGSSPARREVWWGAEPEPTAVIDLTALARGQVIDGPALIEGWGAVHAVPPGWTARRPDDDSLLWERSS